MNQPDEKPKEPKEELTEADRRRTAEAYKILEEYANHLRKIIKKLRRPILN